MNNCEFKVGDLVRVNSSYVRGVERAALGWRSARREVCNDDIGIVVSTAPHPRWPHLITVYWSILQKEVELQRAHLAHINEKA
jgi:hypothetical protein